MGESRRQHILANLLLWRYNVRDLKDSILDGRLRHALNLAFRRHSQPSGIVMNEHICPHCRFPNRQGAKFCAMCGRPLSPPDAGRASDAPDSDFDDEPPTAPRDAIEPMVHSGASLHAFRDHQSLDLRVGWRTDAGRVRELNEDSLLVLQNVWNNRAFGRPAGLFVVADGMGGHEGGEIASGMLIRSLGRRAATELLPLALDPGDVPFDPQAWLTGAIRRSNEEIYEWAREAGFEMGTTIVAALLMDDVVVIAHVGDSRAYLINASHIERLTVDHSLVESLVVSNQISREEARVHPQANVIYRTIGDQSQVSVDMRQLRLVPGERLLLCSDGLSGMLADEAIRELVMGALSPQAACDALVEAANEMGGEDNCSVVVIQLLSL